MNSVSLQAREATEVSQSGDAAPARIGPNAVIQTLHAVSESEGPAVADRVARLAGVPDIEATQMIPEERFVRLVAALRDELPLAASARILARSGSLTAEYVASHRIPAFFRGLLRLLPPRLSLPLLLAAFRQHAWTFAGRSNFVAAGAYPGEIVLDDAPTCRDGYGETMTGEYYAAAFEGLLSLACAGVHVVEVQCRSNGAGACHFEIQTEPRLSTESTSKKNS